MFGLFMIVADFMQDTSELLDEIADSVEEE